jgi:hypothetical protein
MRRALGVLACGLMVSALLGQAASAHLTYRSGDCAWAVKDDPDRVNVAFPDEGAEYWLTRFVAVPGMRMTIYGQFPTARYFSFNLYEGSSPVDAVADYELTNNDGMYVLHVEFGPPPETRAPDTLYAPGMNGEPILIGNIIYRVYLPEGDNRGGVPLPQVVFESEGPDAIVTDPLPSCEQYRPSESAPLNDTVKQLSLPVDGLGVAAQPPQWVVSRSRPQPTAVGPATIYTGNAFFANMHNEYLRLATTRAAGDVVAFRAKAPTRSELRYWSICTNDLPTTRFVACLADEQAHPDADGYMTVVISDAAHKPSNLRPTDDWIPSGPYADFFILYRHMLPDPLFAGAIQRVENVNRPQDTMGAYYPDTRVCTKAAFEAERCGLP